MCYASCVVNSAEDPSMPEEALSTGLVMQDAEPSEMAQLVGIRASTQPQVYARFKS